MKERLGEKERRVLELLEKEHLSGKMSVRMYKNDSPFPYEGYDEHAIKRLYRLAKKGYITIFTDIDPKTKRKAKFIKLNWEKLIDLKV